ADTTGALGFSIRGRDALGNDTTLEGSLVLDNLPPKLTMAIEPAPGKIAGSLQGEVYVSRVLLQGGFSDEGGSGMQSLVFTVRNGDGDHVNSSPEAIPLVDGKFRRV